MTKKEILDYLYPEYSEAVCILDQYTNFELDLLEECPEDIDSIEAAVIFGIQWEIVSDVFGSIIDNWDDFYNENEGTLMDFCNRSRFLEYDSGVNAYVLNNKQVISLATDLVNDSEGDYTINEVDFRELINRLNSSYPIKFIYD